MRSQVFLAPRAFIHEELCGQPLGNCPPRRFRNPGSFTLWLRRVPWPQGPLVNTASIRQMQEDRESYKSRFYGLDLYMVLIISAGEARTCSLAVGLEEKGS